MKRNSVVEKVFGGVIAAGVLSGLFIKFKDRLTPKPVNVSVKLQTSDMAVLAEKCKKQLSLNLEKCAEENYNKAEGQTAMLLSECEESSVDIIKYIQPKAELLSSNLSTSPFSKITAFLFGPIISFLIAAVSTGMLISFKWKAEQDLSPELLKLYNPLIIISAAVVFHLLLNIISTVARNDPKQKKTITVGVKLAIPEESSELFSQMQLDRVKKYTGQIAKAYSSPAKLNDPMLQLLSRAYCDIYQAEMTEDMTNIFGYVKPKCALALKNMDVDIIESYSEKTAGYFSVLEAPGFGRSMVIKPALVLKGENCIVSMGEYVNGPKQ